MPPFRVVRVGDAPKQKCAATTIPEMEVLLYLLMDLCIVIRESFLSF